MLFPDSRNSKLSKFSKLKTQAWKLDTRFLEIEDQDLSYYNVNLPLTGMEGELLIYFHLIQFLRFPVWSLQYHMYYILISWFWQVGWLVDWLSRCLDLICICSSSNHRHPIIPHAEFLSYMCDALKYSLFCQLERIICVYLFKVYLQPLWLITTNVTRTTSRITDWVINFALLFPRPTVQCCFVTA